MKTSGMCGETSYFGVDRAYSMWRDAEGCSQLGMAPGGPCNLVRNWVEHYSEGDIEMVEVEMVKFAKFWLLGEWNGVRGLEAERPFRVVSNP